QSAAMAESGANDVVLVRRDAFQQAQHAQGMVEYFVVAPQQPRRVPVVALVKAFPYSLQLPRRALNQQLRGLVSYLKGQLVGMQHFFRRLLQCEQFVGAQVALVIGGSSSRQNG